MKRELTDRQNKVFTELTKSLNTRYITGRAARDNEKPMGFLLTYIRDNYNMPKTEGFAVAENLLEYFGIDNERPWKKVKNSMGKTAAVWLDK